MSDYLIGKLIRLDGLAGLSVGVFVLCLAQWLTGLYGLPASILYFSGVMNLLYGTYSTILASLRYRPLLMVQFLSVANCSWAGLCFAYVFAMPPTATLLGVGAAVFEGLFVGGLGIIEWYYRKRLAGPRAAALGTQAI